ncbi:MAG: hypothetical protein ACREBR_00995 [bacterium]
MKCGKEYSSLREAVREEEARLRAEEEAEEETEEEEDVTDEAAFREARANGLVLHGGYVVASDLLKVKCRYCLKIMQVTSLYNHCRSCPQNPNVARNVVEARKRVKLDRNRKHAASNSARQRRNYRKAQKRFLHDNPPPPERDTDGGPISIMFTNHQRSMSIYLARADDVWARKQVRLLRRRQGEAIEAEAEKEDEAEEEDDDEDEVMEGATQPTTSTQTQGEERPLPVHNTRYARLRRPPADNRRQRQRTPILQEDKVRSAEADLNFQF